MQQTEKYKFNIIDPSDAFGPEKLNENAQKLETALLAHKAETDAALGTKADKTTLDALTKTVIANKTAADTTIAAVEKGANLVHLAGPLTRASSGAALKVNLAGIDITKYRALLVFVRYNNLSTFSACGMSVNLTGPGGAAMIWIYRADTTVAIAAQASYGSGSSYGLQGTGKHDAVSWSSLTSITFDNAVFFADVYGIKA